jgi:hypothetical protein
LGRWRADGYFPSVEAGLKFTAAGGYKTSPAAWQSTVQAGIPAPQKKILKKLKIGLYKSQFLCYNSSCIKGAHLLAQKLWYLGSWLSWESAAFASQRSRVRSPSGPSSHINPNLYPIGIQGSDLLFTPADGVSPTIHAGNPANRISAAEKFGRFSRGYR